MTDAAGHASIRWRLGTTAQTQRIIARGAVIIGSSVQFAEATFTANGTAGAAAAIQLLAPSVMGLPGTPLDTLTARVTDRFGNAVNGAPIVWIVEAGGGSVHALSAQTDGFGAAQAVFTLGPTNGDHVLSVRSAALTDRVTAFAASGFLASSVVVGGTHSCAIARSGDAYCWGSNSSWQLGTGTTDQAPQRFPTRVATSVRFTSLVAGPFHTCGLTSAGDAYCWGSNDSGALGSPFSTAVSPTRVATTESFTALAAGGYHTCGLTSNKTILCWGDHTAGQIGDGSDRSTFESRAQARRPVPTPVAGGHAFVALAAAFYTTCAITTAGDTYCWGGNMSRELGTGVAGICRLTVSSFYYDEDDVWSCRTSPVRVDVPGKLASIVAAGFAICGVTTGSELICWGNGLPRAERVPSGPVSAAWVLGSTVCGHTGDAVLCWSLVAPSGFSPFPRIHVFDDDTTPLVGMTGTGASSCGLSRTQPAVAHCWGNNESGQVGNGTTVFRRQPVAVGFPRRSQ